MASAPRRVISPCHSASLGLEAMTGRSVASTIPRLSRSRDSHKSCTVKKSEDRGMGGRRFIRLRSSFRCASAPWEYSAAWVRSSGISSSRARFRNRSASVCSISSSCSGVSCTALGSGEEESGCHIQIILTTVGRIALFDRCPECVFIDAGSCHIFELLQVGDFGLGVFQVFWCVVRGQD